MMKKLIQQKCAKLEQESATLNAKRAASVSKPLFLKQASEDIEKDELHIAREKLSIISSKLSLNSSVDILEDETSKNTESARTNTRVLLSPEPDHKQSFMDDKSPSEYSDKIFQPACFHESDVICVSDYVGKHSDTNTITVTISDSDDDFDKDKPTSNKESDKMIQSISSPSDVFKGNENDRNPENPNVHQPIPFLEPETSNKDAPSTDQEERTAFLEKTTPNINITILKDLLKDIRDNRDIQTFNHPLHQPRVSKVHSYEQLMKNRLSGADDENNSLDIRSNETVLQTSNIPAESNSTNTTMGLNRQGGCAAIPAADSCTNRENSESNDTRSMANFQPNMHELANTKPAVNYRISEIISGQYMNTHLRYNKQEMTYNNHDQSQHPHHNADNSHVFNRNILNPDYSNISGPTCHDRIVTPGDWNYTTKPFVAAIAPVNTQPCARLCYHRTPYNNHFDLVCTPHNTMTGDNSIQSNQPVIPIPELSPSDNLVTPNHSYSQYPYSTPNTPKFHEATVADTIAMKLDKMIAIYRSHERADSINYNVRSNILRKNYEYRSVSYPIARRERSADRIGKSRYHRINGGREHAGMENKYHRSTFGTMRFGLPEDRVQRAGSRPPDGRSNLEPRHEGPFEDRRRRAASMARNLIHINTKDSIINHKLERTLSSPQLPKNKNVEKEIEELFESFTDSNNITKEETEIKSMNSQPENQTKNKAYGLKRQQNLNKEKDKLQHGMIESRCRITKINKITTTGKNATMQVPKHNQPPESAVLSENKLNEIKSEYVADSKSRHSKKVGKIKLKKIKNNKKAVNEKEFPESFIESNKKPKKEPAKISLSSQTREKLTKKSYDQKSYQNPIKDILDKNKHEIFTSPEKTTRVDTLKTTRKKTFKIFKQLPVVGLTGRRLEKYKSNEENENKTKGCIYKKPKTTVLTKEMSETKTINKKKFWLALSRDELTKQRTTHKVRKAKKRKIYSNSDAMQENKNNMTEPWKGKNVSETSINEELLNSPSSNEETPVIKIKKSKIRRIVYSDSDSDAMQENKSNVTVPRKGKNASATTVSAELLNRPSSNEETPVVKIKKSKIRRIVYSDSDSDAMQGNKNNLSEPWKGKNVSATTVNEELLNSPSSNEETPVIKIKKSKIRRIIYSDSDSEILQETVKVSKNASADHSDRGVEFKITDNLNSKINTPNIWCIDFIKQGNDFDGAFSISTNPRSKAAAMKAHTEENNNSEIISCAITEGMTNDETLIVNNHDAMPDVVGNMYKRTSATPGDQSNDKSLTSLEDTVKIASDTGTPIKKNKEGHSTFDKEKKTESRNYPDYQDLCITTQMEQNELNKGALFLSNESDILENAIQYSNQEQSLRKRLSVAWKLLKDIPKSILLSFIYDLCHKRKKEEIEEIIKCLNKIVSDDNEVNVQRSIKVKAKRKRGRPPKRKPTSTEIDEGVSNSENKQSGSTKSGTIYDGSSSLSTTETNKNQLDSMFESENNGKFITGISPQSDDVSTETVNARIQKNDIKGKSEQLDVIGFNNNCDSHFKICNGDSGAEYVCCINGNKNHFKSKLKVQMKKHVVAEHPEIWNGYCSFCKKNISLDGLFTFKDCFEHMFYCHLDDFPTQDTKKQNTSDDVSNPTLGVTYQFDKTTEETDALRTDGGGVNGITQNVIDQANIPSPHHKQQKISNPVTATIGIKNTIKTKLKGITIEKEDLIFSAEASCSQTSVPKMFEFEMIYQYEEHQLYIMKSKHSTVISSMLSEEKLLQTYKCACRFCAYTTNSLDLAKEHITAHQGTRVKNENVLICAYCDFNCKNNIDDLLKHVFETHGRCRYTCNQCFYRAAASQLVQSHMHRVHPKSLKTILEASSSDCRNEEESLPQHVKIQRYYCNNKSLTPECKRSYFSQGSFIRHLQHHDAPYLCYICNHASNQPEKLLQHMSDHGLKKYHCTWCSEGGDTEEEFMAHFSARHPTRQPQAYLRKVDGMQEDKSRIIVLPLVELNKSTVSTHLVTPNATENDPVIEANKAHNLEELIQSVYTNVQADGEVSTPEIISKQSDVAIANNPTNQPSTSVETNFRQKTTSEDNSTKQILKRKLPKCAGSEKIHKRVRSSEQDLPTQIQELNLHGSTLYACSLCTNLNYQDHIDEVLYGVGEVETVRDEHGPVKESHILKEDSSSKDNNAKLLQYNAIHESGAKINTNKSYRVEEISPICIRLTATAEPRKKTTVTT